MFKRKVGRVVLGVVAAAGIVLGATNASQAATLTWYSGNATEWSTYSETASNYNNFSRTGQYFEIPDVLGSQQRLVYSKIWFGTSYTGSWAGSQSIGGTRQVGVAGRGKFQFYWGGVQTYNQYSVIARATDAKLVGGSRAAVATTLEGLSENDLLALANPASDYHVSVSDFRLLAEDDGTRLLSAQGDGYDVYTVLTADSIAFSTKSTDAEQDQRAAALYVVNPDAKVKAQYVFTDQEHRAEVAAVGGLTEIADGVFVDDEVDSRVAFDPTLSRSASQYVVPLSTGD